jgi:hypothetical protein
LRDREVFVLKGALLFELWTEQRYRPTRDADFLARGENAPTRFVQIFRELCAMDVEPDGFRFDPESVAAERIAEDADYPGVRATSFIVGFRYIGLRLSLSSFFSFVTLSVA